MLPITEKLLDNYNRPKTALKKQKAVIIHWTANTGRGANAMANRNYFNTKPAIYDAKGNKTYASAHYVVDDKTIVQCIPDNELAYHVGATSYQPNMRSLLNIPASDSPNYYTIGIEMCINSDGDFEKTKQNTIELTRYLLEKYGLTINNVFRHYDITGKNCPAMMVSNAADWQQFLNDVAGSKRELAKERLKVNVDLLNVRTGAGTNFSIQRKLYFGDIVEKIGEDGVWYQIAANEWVHSSYVDKLIMLTINVSVLNVRSGAGTGFSVKRQLHLGDIVTKIGESNGWYKIAEDEWIHSDYVI